MRNPIASLLNSKRYRLLASLPYETVKSNKVVTRITEIPLPLLHFLTEVKLDIYRKHMNLNSHYPEKLGSNL